jgi:hypothetical protein
MTAAPLELRIAETLERIASALERAHPDPARRLYGDKQTVRYTMTEDELIAARAALDRQDAKNRDQTDAIKAATLYTMPENLPPIPSTATMPDPDGWIAWNGGACPVAPTTLVEIRLRDGTVSGPIRAGVPTWRHAPYAGAQFDIIAYRLAK